MRICVYGAGSVGGYLAARLAKAGREVSVVARGPHLAAIRVGGLTLQTPEERFTVPVAASDDPADLGRQDLVIVGAKHPALPGIAERIGPLLGPDTPVVFAMNGVLWFTADLPRLDPTGSIRRHIGIERALGLIIESPNEVVEPGVVENTGKRNRFTLGEAVPGRSARAEGLYRALSGAGFEVELADDVRRPMWAKLSRNVSSAPVCILTGAMSSQLVEDPAMKGLMQALTVEVLAVAAALGFADLGVDPDASNARGNRPQHKPSMLQDLERGRPMEIDAMLLAVQDLARRSSVPTPVLDVLLPVVTMKARLAGLY
ncbi:MAG TPA: 2-dehydropantoate 2-reductase [Geminicoccaceae bacterium]|nr:2-dehydropantoate 2-reductase [Geminicoccus sp.]HMU50133.1 2-dehydropantoate 2-reductase [Geminicoccaceae bacterium]